MSRNTTIVLIVILLIVIAIIVGLSYSNNQPSTPTDQSQTAEISPSPADTSAVPAPTPQNVSVSYTDRGFSPASITIHNGDSVTWTNNSSGRMWVASDPHPTHTDLPGFDEMAAVNAGGSWTYTFSVTGTHGYHNHTNPGMRGTVTVQ